MQRNFGSIADLGEGEIAVAATPFYEEETLELEGQTYVVKENDAFPGEEEDYLASITSGAAYIIVPDETELVRIFDRLGQNWNQERVDLTLNYDIGFDIDGNAKEKLAAEAAVREAVATWENTTASGHAEYARAYIECREENREEYYSLNGGLLFLGLFLGTMFLMVPAVRSLRSHSTVALLNPSSGTMPRINRLRSG